MYLKSNVIGPLHSHPDQVPSFLGHVILIEGLPLVHYKLRRVALGTRMRQFRLRSDFGDLILNFLDDKTTFTKKNFPSAHFCCRYFIFCFHLLVMRVDNPDDIDRMSFNLPIVKEMGDQVQLEVKPLRAYEAFATELNKKVTGEEDSFQELPTIPRPKAGLFFWITITIEYPGKIDVAQIECWIYNYIYH